MKKIKAAYFTVFFLLSLRSAERLGCLLGGRSQRWIPGLAIERGSRMAVGRRERPHLPTEAWQRGSAHAYGEPLKHTADQSFWVFAAPQFNLTKNKAMKPVWLPGDTDQEILLKGHSFLCVLSCQSDPLACCQRTCGALQAGREKSGGKCL